MKKNLSAVENILGEIVGSPSFYRRDSASGRIICDETEVIGKIKNLFANSDCGVEDIPLQKDKNRSNLLVTKGNGDKSVLLYAHVDTIEPDWNKPQFKLKRSGDWYSGVGVYDMKAGVAILIDLLRSVKVPNGIRLVGLFSPDEELHSRGVSDVNLHKKLFRHQYMLGFSPEIPSMREGFEDKDFPKTLIIGRKGIVKMKLRIDTAPSHGAKRTPNAYKVHKQVMERLEDMQTPPHPVMGEEMLDVSDSRIMRKKGKGLSHPTYAKTILKQIIVEPSTIRSTLRTGQQKIAALEEERYTGLPMDRWDPEKVKISLQRDKTQRSYLPYISSKLDSPAATAFFETVKSEYGGYTQEIGQSVADSTYLVNRMRREGQDFPWIEACPVGEGEHEATEKVSCSSIDRLANALRHFIMVELLRQHGG